MRDVKIKSDRHLRETLADLVAAKRCAADELEESGGAAGDPLEWFDEQIDEIKTELRRRNSQISA